jgi:hypothetical protein
LDAKTTPQGVTIARDFTPNTIEGIGHFLAGLADLLILIAGKLREFAVQLIEEARLQTPKPQPSRS